MFGNDMTLALLTRRHLLLAASAAAMLPGGALADEIIDLVWADLIPGPNDAIRVLRGVVQHGELSTGFEQPQATGVTTEYDGRIVRLPGYLVPIEYDGTGVTAFILVPFVGACVHVPPPPANQLVLVTTERPYELKGLFDPVTVIGMFGTSATSTDLAAIGYALSADRIEPYREG